MLRISEDIAVGISGPNEAKITKKEQVGNGTRITYLPVTPGEYNVDIKCKGKHIYGSPFISKVTGMYLDVRWSHKMLDAAGKLCATIALDCDMVGAAYCTSQSETSAFENLYLL